MTTSVRGIGEGVCPTLLEMAALRVHNDAFREKTAAPGGMDPAMMMGVGGGMPPGGAAPGGMPGMGGMPMPVDPAMSGMGGMGMPTMPVDPAMGGMGGGQPGAAPQKIKPEQMFQMINYRLYNLQMQLTLILKGMKIEVPPEALVLPPGAMMAPPPEAALPGAPQDPTANQAAAPASGGASAIAPISPMQGAFPSPAGGDGGQPKQAAVRLGAPYTDRMTNSDIFATNSVTNNLIAAAAALRSRIGQAK